MPGLGIRVGWADDAWSRCAARATRRDVWCARIRATPPYDERVTQGRASPRHRAEFSLLRAAVAGGAVLVTVLAVAGATGIIPSAALGAVPSAKVSQHPTPEPSADSNVVVAQDAADGTESAGTGTTRSTPGAKQVEQSTVLSKGSGRGRRVVYDISDQRVWLVGDGNTLVRTYPVSGGDNDLLQPGDYTVFQRNRHAVSYDYRETMNYMVSFAHGESALIGFHDIPAYQDGTLAQTPAQLGTPLSAGCIRQQITDARAMWRFAPIGTDVVVTT